MTGVQTCALPISVSNTNGAGQTNVQAVDPPADAPSGIVFPYGMFEFTVTGIEEGGTVHMEVYVPYDPVITGYWKKNVNTGQWEDIAQSVTKVGNQMRITFNLTDGGDYDEDVVSGQITDQGGPGGPETVKAVPTMTEWGMIVFILLAGLMGVFYMRRRAYSA